MGKSKQQVISRFFAPKPAPPSSPPPASPSSPPKSPPLPMIAATVSFSPAAIASKRSLSQTLTPPSKKPKPSPPSLHQRFVEKLLDPPEPSRTPYPLPQNPRYTPLELQVLELKSAHPGVVLMIEVGYKYRFFGEDAEIAARVLGIFAHVDHNFLTASIPTFRVNFHVRRLVGAGHKVGVVKQTETAAIKAHGSNRLGPFSRGLSALYTKATIEAAEGMGDEGEEGSGGLGSNYLLCVSEKGVFDGKGGVDVRVAIVGVEISTGDVVFGEFDDNVMRPNLEAVILSLSPAEILLGEPLSKTTEKFLSAYAGPTSNVRVERTSRDCFNNGGALAEVMSLYENIDDATLTTENDAQNINNEKESHNIGIEEIMTMPELTVQALALTIRHLKEFGLEKIICYGASFRPFASTIELTLSANALHQLEILKNNYDGSMEGSVLQAMNNTHTTFGLRLLKHWVTHPLCDRNSISARLDAVSELAESIGSHKGSQNLVDLEEDLPSYASVHPNVAHVLSSVLMNLGKLPDIQRGITRIYHRTATTAEFIVVIHAILVSGKQLQTLHIEGDGDVAAPEEKTVKSALLRRLISTASSSSTIAQAAKLLSFLNKDAADQGDMLNLFNASNDQFPEVARSRIAVQMAKEKLDSLIVHYRKQIEMPNLVFTTVSGTTHLIELPSDARAPPNWVRVSSTKKAIRYHPPEVLTALDMLLLAKEELAVACRTTWESFLMGFGKQYVQFQAAVQALAALDCLHSLAILSRNKNYVCPVFVNDDEPCQIHIDSGRHPVLESVLQDSFVPNNTNLHVDAEYCQIVTGPNMGGKSCYIRQVALIAIMAQVGSFVPALSAKLHVLDGIYTRLGASDSIQQGTSTFFEELSEASHILQNCSSRSLVIIDELGRGTSTHDGVALAYATLHYLLERKKCMVLFVTHYPKIMDILDEFKGSVGAYHVSYLTSQEPLGNMESKLESSVKNLDRGEVTFLYKVVCGASDKSFGLNVARLAQLPSSCIERAAIMASKLESEISSRVRIRPPELLLSVPEVSCGENKLLEDLTGVCSKIFFYIRSALSDTDTADIFFSLKEARKLALKIVERLPLLII